MKTSQLKEEEIVRNTKHELRDSDKRARINGMILCRVNCEILTKGTSVRRVARVRNHWEIARPKRRWLESQSRQNRGRERSSQRWGPLEKRSIKNAKT